ncbi:hypothetical protein [Intestinimonas butyriciproducens]|uniref:hypothetical protein n=1 Tax=Intestinimonas butyriciproducens TaxID=1297617 RepID=UPI00242A76A0|nr:hypothetical protein [Intestinimonas butyriciproducens]MCI6364375.1 hypothetical protein [Intestinimonas butyriciproducens]MDY3616012.1 hypothetical protein [Intestinimonas butyriciproducens]
MNKVFAVEICNKDQEAELQLPATDYQLLDIIERLEIIEEVKPSVCIYQYEKMSQTLHLTKNAVYYRIKRMKDIVEIGSIEEFREFLAKHNDYIG